MLHTLNMIGFAVLTVLLIAVLTKNLGAWRALSQKKCKFSTWDQWKSVIESQYAVQDIKPTGKPLRVDFRMFYLATKLVRVNAWLESQGLLIRFGWYYKFLWDAKDVYIPWSQIELIECGKWYGTLKIATLSTQCSKKLYKAIEQYQTQLRSIA